MLDAIKTFLPTGRVRSRSSRAAAPTARPRLHGQLVYFPLAGSDVGIVCHQTVRQELAALRGGGRFCGQRAESGARRAVHPVRHASTRQVRRARVYRGSAHRRAELLRRRVGRLECRTVHQYDGGDHVIFVGEVLSLDMEEADPLVYHRRRYRRLVD